MEITIQTGSLISDFKGEIFLNDGTKIGSFSSLYQSKLYKFFSFTKLRSIFSLKIELKVNEYTLIIKRNSILEDFEENNLLEIYDSKNHLIYKINKELNIKSSKDILIATLINQSNKMILKLKTSLGALSYKIYTEYEEMVSEFYYKTKYYFFPDYKKVYLNIYNEKLFIPSLLLSISNIIVKQKR